MSILQDLMSETYTYKWSFNKKKVIFKKIKKQYFFFHKCIDCN